MKRVTRFMKLRKLRREPHGASLFSIANQRSREDFGDIDARDAWPRGPAVHSTPRQRAGGPLSPTSLTTQIGILLSVELLPATDYSDALK